jgi:hypothetical protein
VTASRWITIPPRAEEAGGGAVDQQGAEVWIRGRAPLKSKVSIALM